MRRSVAQKIIDFFTFPLRAITIFEENRWGLSSLRTDRFDYVAREVIGYCLDVGCGRNNIFIKEYLSGNGMGIDVFPYEGLAKENIVEDITRFPFMDCSFDSITFIANINHVPKSMRDIELAEAYRCLKPSGNIILTMGNPLAEILIHKVLFLYDRIFGTCHDVDAERGMRAGEEYYLRDSEIIVRLSKARFQNIRKKYFVTQWGLNHLFVARKAQNTIED